MGPRTSAFPGPGCELLQWPMQEPQAPVCLLSTARPGEAGGPDLLSSFLLVSLPSVGDWEPRGGRAMGPRRQGDWPLPHSPCPLGRLGAGAGAGTFLPGSVIWVQTPGHRTTLEDQVVPSPGGSWSRPAGGRP